MPGIKDTLTTGKISTAIIPIIVGTNIAAVMTRIFIICTIVVRAAAGIKVSRAAGALMARALMARTMMGRAMTAVDSH